jgi:hypothetical protein
MEHLKLQSLGTQNPVSLKVSKYVKEQYASSLQNGSKKDKAVFLKLSQADKRAWRDALQRNVAAIKQRCARRSFTHKPKGLSRHRIARLSAQEEQLVKLLGSRVELQSGASVAAVAGVAASMSVLSLCKQVSSTAEKAGSLMDDVKGIVEKLIESLKSLGGFAWKVALAAFVFWLCQEHDLGVVASVLISVVVYHVPSLKDWLSGIGGVKLQSGVEMVSKLTSMILTCWCPGKDFRSVSGEFTKRVSNFPRTSDGLEKFMKEILSIVEQMVNFVLSKFGKGEINLSQQAGLMARWRRKTLDHLQWMASNPVLELAKLREIREHYLEGFGFLQVLHTPEARREVTLWTDKLGMALKPHEGALSASSNVRPMPYMAMFGGGSGVGKTSLLRYMATITLWLSGEVSAKDALANLWQKGTTEYWNGYVGQKCLVMDDAFQVRGVAGASDSEAMQVIRAVGNWSYPLNFADVESKGKFYLNTPLIVGTTNEKNIKSAWAEYITAPEAVVRRFQSAFWVEVSPEYAVDGRFDYERVTSMVSANVADLVRRQAANEELTFEDIMGAIPWDAWVLYPHRFDAGSITSLKDVRGLRGVVMDAASTIKRRKEKNDKEVSDIQALLDMLSSVPKPVEFQSGVTSTPDIASMLQAKLVDSRGDDGIKVTFDVPFDMPQGKLDLIELLVEKAIQQRQIEELGTLKKSFGGPMVAFDRDPPNPPNQAHASAVDTLDSLQQRSGSNFWDVISSMVHTAAEWVRSFAARFAPPLAGVSQRLGDLSLLTLTAAAFSSFMYLAVNAVMTSWSLMKAGLAAMGLGFSKVKTQSNEGKAVAKKGKDFVFATPVEVFDRITLQAGASQEATYDKVSGNIVKIELYHADGVYYGDLGHMLGVASDVFILPLHFREDLMNNHRDSFLKLCKSTSSVTMDMSVRDFLKLRHVAATGFDLMAISMGRSGLKMVKSICHLFLQEREIASILRGSNMASRLYVVDSKVVKGTQNSETVRDRTIYTSNTTEYVRDGVVASGKRLAGVVKYRIATRPGHCGAPLMLDNIANFGNRCIMALHSAGRDAVLAREGYGTIVTQEVVAAMVTQLQVCKERYGEDGRLSEQTIKPITDDEQAFLESSGLLAGSFEIIGRVDKPLNIGTQTKIMASEMQQDQLFGSAPSAPAILKPVMIDDERVYPMVNGLKAYQTPVLYKNPSDLKPVVSMAMKKHWEVTYNFPRNVLTFEEAIEPPAHWKLKPLNRKTSAGYKYAQFATPQNPGKTWALGHEGDITWDSDGMKILREDVDHLIYQATKGVRLLHVCVDFLKDELRPLKKVESVATRVIAGTEVDYTIACRMYFGAFMASTFATYIENGMAPGINHYTEWGLLAEKLLNAGTKMFDGDFSRFDSSEQPYFHEAILDYIQKWYRKDQDWNEEDELVREILWMDLVHSRHLTGLGNSLEYVVQWNKSLPSGHPLTTIVNSMYSLISLAHCYVARVHTYDMWDHAYVCTFGDDNIASVDDEICDLFNQVTVAESMADLGLTYTSGHKDRELVPYTGIDDITFLKRSFVVDEDSDYVSPNLGWVAPLDPNSFLFEPYWYKNARDPAGDMQRRVEHMLGEMSLHGQDMWDKYGESAIKWCLDRGLHLQHYDRAAWRAYIKTRMDVWF